MSHNLTQMQWIDLRDELRRLRVVAFANQVEFSLASGLNRKTISRVEAVKRAPNYQPEYDTIERWLRACKDNSSVSDFLKKFEGVTSSDKPGRDTVPSTQIGVPLHGSFAAEGSAVLASLDDIALLERLALALIHARAALQREAALRRADPQESGSSSGLPVHGGSDAANLRTVK